MPVYPQNPTYISGFHNNKIVNGKNDREYSALDIREPYRSVFSNGVKPNDNGVLGDDLQVQLVGGMQIRVAAGRGIFGGAFFWNKSTYNITLDTASSSTRYDCVIIQNDDTENVRNTTIYVKSLDHIPTISDLKRQGDDINEYCLGYVIVPALSTSILGSNIVDTRLDQNLCGVITGVFNQVDGAELNKRFEDAFFEWFGEIKDAFVANATLIHTYTNNVTTEAVGQTDVEIGIPQYNMNTDSLIVSVNGNIFAKGVQYNVIDNTKVRFTIGFPVINTQILFQVFKSVDGSAAESVVSQVNTLINDMNSVNQKLEFDYYCNGVNDNIQISNIVRTFYSVNDYKSLKINVIGTIGLSVPFGGDGTTASPYSWFNFVNPFNTNRIATVDFTRASEITPTITNGTYNVIFRTSKINIIGANVIASNTTNGTNIRISNATTGAIKYENCRFWITTYKDGFIAPNGTFTNCRGSVANVTNNSYCFLPSNDGLVKINGGEYYAYTGDSTKQSSVVGQSSADAVSILYGVNAPTSARSGFYQTNSILQWAGGGILNCTDLISALPMIVVSGISNIRGTIEKNKPNLL